MVTAAATPATPATLATRATCTAATQVADAKTSADFRLGVRRNYSPRETYLLMGLIGIFFPVTIIL